MEAGDAGGLWPRPFFNIHTTNLRNADWRVGSYFPPQDEGQQQTCFLLPKRGFSDIPEQVVLKHIAGGKPLDLKISL